MENKKICPACGAENREDFQFCKNCGTKLPNAVVTPPAQPLAEEPVANEPIANEPVVNEPQTPSAPFYAPNTSAAELSELETLSFFIGAGGFNYAKKQLNRKARFKKSSWNWPVFLFGFLLGLPFVWFYYRKMFKQGTAILIATLAISLSISGCVAGFLSPIFDAVSTLDFLPSSTQSDKAVSFVSYRGVDDDIFSEDDFKEYFENGLNENSPVDISEEDIDQMLSVLSPKISQMFFCLASIFILGILNFIFVLLLAIFADRIFQNHCDKKIALLKSTGHTGAASLQAAGGTSTLAAVLIGIAFSIVSGILCNVIAISGMSSLFSALLF